MISGAFDVVANSLGSGLIQADQLCTIMGTWNINISLSSTPVIPRYIRQTILYADSSQYAVIDSSATSAANLEWFLSNILRKPGDYELFNRSIADTSQENEIIFTPFICSGLANSNPGGSFHRLRNYHTDEDVLRAVAEGILFAHRYHIENIIQEGVSVNSVLATGGGSKNRNWCQMLADILQTEIILPQSQETGILGNCLLAAYGIGLFPSLEESTRALVRTERKFSPDPQKREYYDKKYDIFKEYIA